MRCPFNIVFCLVLASFQTPLALSSLGADFKISKESDAIVVRDGDGPVVLQYQLNKTENSPLSVESACYIHPLTTPQGVVLTDVAPSDHRHHRGVFQAWVEVHGTKDADFWGWGVPAPTQNRLIENLDTSALVGRGSLATFRCRNAWKAENETLAHEIVIAILRDMNDAHVLDLEFIVVPDQDLILSQWAFGGFCVRARKDAVVAIRNATGPVSLTPPVHTDPKSDWPDAPWYALDLSFPDGTNAGIAVLNHPQNPKTLWHNHPGLSMLNPCITAPGDVSIKTKQRFLLRYRLVTYDGLLPAARLQELFDQWIQ